MISCIRGKLFEAGMDYVIIDAGGVGYEIMIHQRTYARLPVPDTEVLLYTHLQVLENEFKLYGFLDREELRLFKKLLTISGLGAKTALNVLSFMEPAAFYQAIVSGDEKTLTKIPGIGKKSAQRLLFEMKGKIEDIEIEPLAVSEGNSMEDAIDALEALGYTRSEVYPVLADLNKSGKLGSSVEENIKLVLKQKARDMR